MGTYEIVGTLGAGGMGEVYRAKDLRLGREVAVKVLPAELSSSADRLARFEREARTVAGLNHPNIVTLHSVEDEDGIRFLTMELVEGQTLSELVTPGGLPLPRVLELTIPLTDALVAAHERGIVHRDLKPGNVMVTREGRVKVLDFGLAKMSGMEDEAATIAATSPISEIGQVLGTIPYMAPEQLKGETVDARSDLFAMGILLYELVTGRRPFGGETSIDIGHAILRGTPEPIDQVRKDLPNALEQLVTRCLEKDPRKRIQTALEVNNELRRMRKATERAETAEKDPAGTATIAVLPFVNRSASADDEYFSDGLADELINVLAKINGLRVSARTSSFHFKGKDVELSEMGKALNVATILEGSVRKAGNRVRISVQLVKVEDGFHLWSETYDRTLEDIFAVQDDIAHSVVKELRAKLLGEAADSDASGEARAEVAKAAKGRASNPEAYRLFLQARHVLGRRTKEDTVAGIQYLKDALELDAEFALAWRDLGSAYALQAGVGWTQGAEGFERAREAVERALSLEPELAEGHATLGWIRMNYDWDWRGAEASFRRALELEPGNARVLVPAGVLAANLGRLDEGISLYRRAAAQDPLRASAFSNLGLALDAAGRHDEAEVELRRALMLAPLATAIHSVLSINLVRQGRGEEALAEVRKEPVPALRLWALAIICHAMGQPGESDRALEELLEKWSDGGAFQIAEVFAERGNADAAFEWLERAHAQHDSGICEIKPSPSFRSFHGDPRWAAFLRKMGFDE